MTDLELLTSSVLPLLVAFFNLLIAGHSLVRIKDDPALLGFGLATGGVGVWAVAWLVSVFEPAALAPMQLAGGAGGVIAALGLALAPASEVAAAERRRLVASGLVIFAVLLGALLWISASLDALRLLASVLRVAGLALAGVTAIGWFQLARLGEGKTRRFARRALVLIALCTLGYGVLATLALIDARTGVDPLLLLMLIAESLALLAIVERRVEMHIVLSRAVTYAVLSMVVGGISAAALRFFFGGSADLQQLALTIGVALLAALVFLGLGELMSRGVARLLFPGRARLADALTASRSEAASMKRRLEQVERLAIAGELATSVAHEIKNPLSPIRGYAQLLEGKLDHVAPEERAMFEKALRIIREESDRIDRRVADLLALAKGDRTASQDGSFDLNRVLLEAIAVAETEPAVRHIVQRLDPALGEVRGSEDEVRGALVNVLKNAAEALQESGGGVIEVETSKEDGRVQIEIRDEGPGLSSDTEDQAFRAFYTTKRGGTGLGLAIARSAVEAAGGSIELASRTDRRGARVTIELEAAGTREPLLAPRTEVLDEPQ